MLMRVLLSGVCILLITACSPRLTSWDPDDYTVASGDTIYSIAWKYEIDPFELARWNNISSPYIIRAGQRLHMEPTPESKKAAAVAYAQPTPRKGTITVRKGDTLYNLARKHDMDARHLAAINGLKSPYTIQPGQTLKLSGAVSTTTTTKKSTGSSKASLPYDNKKIAWQWPVQGKVITTYKRNTVDRKGINIAAKEGNSVKAAAAGKVVYSGNGLISYGNLIIIKHNRTYLSAYAHNRKLLVKEGQMIKSGQKIAELGKTGTDSPRLHFEIRKNGKPVNPIKYLPRS